MPKRKKPGRPKKNTKVSPSVSSCGPEEKPSPAKMSCVSSTSQLEKVDSVSSITNKSADGCSIRCPVCPFISLSWQEAIHHCKYKHGRDVDSHTSRDGQLDKDPCIACMFCDYMTYSTECLETHTALKHPGMLTTSIAKMITKQVSAKIRSDDALFYPGISREYAGKSFIEMEGSSLAAKSDPIIIDASEEKAEDVKPNIKFHAGTKSAHHSEMVSWPLLNPVKVQLVEDIYTDLLASEKVEAGSRGNTFTIETDVAVAVPNLAVKVETLYCLTCPFSNVLIDRLKCHTFVQHPVGAAAATCNFCGESRNAQDITFFCVRENCTYCSSNCSSYQKHLIDCCACQQTLAVVEKARLKSTIAYILECQKKYSLPVEDGFFDLVSVYLGGSLQADQVVAQSSCSVETQTCFPASDANAQNNLLNLPVTTPNNLSSFNFNYTSPRSQLVSPARASLSGPQAGSIQMSGSDHLGIVQQIQRTTTANVQATGNPGHTQGQSSNIHSIFHIPVNTDRVSSDISADVNFGPQQSVQNPNTQTMVSYYQQNTHNYLLDTSISPLTSQQMQQVNVYCPPSDKAASILSTTMQSDQNFRQAAQNQLLSSDGSLSHNNTAYNTFLNQDKANSSFLRQNVEMSPNFKPVESDSGCAPLAAYFSCQSDSSSNCNVNQSQDLTGFGRFSNVVTGQTLVGQQQPGSIPNTLGSQNVCVQQQPSLTTAGVRCSHSQSPLANMPNAKTSQTFCGQQQPILTTSVNLSATDSHKQSPLTSMSNAYAGQTFSWQQQPISATSSVNLGATGRLNQVPLIGLSNPIAGQAFCGQQLPVLTTANLSLGAPGRLNQSPMTSLSNTVAGQTFRGQQQPILTTANLSLGAPGRLNQSPLTSLSNTVAGQTFRGQQHPILTTASVSLGAAGRLDQSPLTSSLNTSQRHANLAGLITQQKRSDSDTVFLFDGFGSQGQSQELGSNNQSHPQLIPFSFHQETPVNTQTQMIVHQLSARVTTGQPADFQSINNAKSNFQPPVSNFHVQGSGTKFAIPLSNQCGYPVNMKENSTADSGIQTSHTSSNIRFYQSDLLPEQRSCVQTVPCQPSDISGFHVTSVSVSEAASVQPTVATSSCLTPVQPVSMQSSLSGPSASSKSVNANSAVSISSLPSSIHNAPVMVNAGMRPRGTTLSAGPPGGTFAPAFAQSHPGHVQRHRQFAPGKEYPRTARMSQGQPRMPAPQILQNHVGGDDDVIITAEVPPQQQQQSCQQRNRSSGYRESSCSTRGKGQTSPAGSQFRCQLSNTRVPISNTPTIPPHRPQKKVDVRKHFEDLICEVNASTDVEEVDVLLEDDIEMWCVTQGKDQSKPSQAKAVDPVKMSYCCIHCGEDQGCKRIMKQHMKAKHNDSFLGAFTDVETGELLFFCPQLPCEFLTYDEQKLEAHLSKCYELDKSKPFDFGTAIKNVKAVKVRQLNVQTRGRSQDDPILLDGQGMKDSFSNSLNDAFSCIVNTSGRPTYRPPVHVQPQVRSALPSQRGTMQGKVPVRHQLSSLRPKPANSMVGMANKILAVHHPRQQSASTHAALRQTSPVSLPVKAPLSQEMQPRLPTSVGHQGLAAPDLITSIVRTPSRPPIEGKQNPFVIVLDADSPEQLDETKNGSSVGKEHPCEAVEQMPVITSYSSTRTTGSTTKLHECLKQGAQTTNAAISQEQQLTSATQDKVFSNKAYTSNSPHTPAVSSGNKTSNSTAATSSAALISCPSHHHNAVTSNRRESGCAGPLSLEKNTVSYMTPTSEVSSSSVSSIHIIEEATDDHNTSGSEHSAVLLSKLKPKTVIFLTNKAPITLVPSRMTRSEISEFGSNQTETPAISLSVTNCTATSSLPGTSQVNTKCVNEKVIIEEKANAIVLEKSVPKIYLPKNLPVRLISKFKEFANQRTVKITSHPSVVDECVGEICYQGPMLDKTAKRVQPVLGLSAGFMSAAQDISMKARKDRCQSFSDAGLISSVEFVQDLTSDVVEEQQQMVVSEAPSQGESQIETIVEKESHFSASTNSVLKSTVSSTHIPEHRQLLRKQKPACNQDAVKKLNTSSSKPDTAEANVGNKTHNIPQTDVPLTNSVTLHKRESLTPSISGVITIVDKYFVEELDCSSPLSHSVATTSAEKDSDPNLTTVLQNFEPVETAMQQKPSIVDNRMSAHSGLEAGVTEKPYRQEPVNAGNKELKTDNQSMNKDESTDDNYQLLTKEGHVSKNVSKTHSIIDKTGKLLLKKTKRGIARKVYDSKEKKEEEDKEIAVKDIFVRRSSRQHKPVMKDYRCDADEIDELMSDDDDEYNISDDVSDTGSEWSNSSKETHKKKIRKTSLPPDPTAFNWLVKGNFKCWLCQKIFSRCFFAKTHIMKKHSEGLYAIDMDRSKETNSVCFLLFCPRTCKYATNTLEAINNHLKNCSNKIIEVPGKDCLELNRHFLDCTYTELLGSLSLEAVLSTTKARKPKDPTQALKTKKSKVAKKSSNMSAVVPRSEMSPLKTKKSKVAKKSIKMSAVVPRSEMSVPSVAATHMGTSNFASEDRSYVSQTRAADAHTPTHRLNQMQQVANRGSVAYCKNSALETPLSHPKNTQAFVTYSSQLPRQYSTAPKNIVPRNTQSIILQRSQSRPLPSLASPDQQMLSTSSLPRASSSISQQSPDPNTNSPTKNQDDIIFIVEDNGTICLD